jgi:hypothetical protein
MRPRNFCVVLPLAALLTAPFGYADEPTQATPQPLSVGKVEESEAKGAMKEPMFGYTGMGGSFAVSKEGGYALFGVHGHPDYHTVKMGATKLKYVGPKRLAQVDGWVCQTDWDGKTAPSKIFFSAEPVYFGLGIHGYAVADYRDATGWAWKMIPLKRWPLMEPTK